MREPYGSPKMSKQRSTALAQKVCTCVSAGKWDWWGITDVYTIIRHSPAQSLPQLERSYTSGSPSQDP